MSAGIKANGNPDLALIVSDRPATAAAVFTLNKAQAAPVLVSKEHLAALARYRTRDHRQQRLRQRLHRRCRPRRGARHGVETARLVGCPVDQVLVASTGVIGVELSLDKIRTGLPAALAALGADHGPQAARAIMTTDPFPKEAAMRDLHRRP